jgi:hypothetical protein
MSSPNSAESSVFDSYHEENRNSACTTVEFTKDNEFKDSDGNNHDINNGDNDTNNIITDDNRSIVYSQYEPVNAILNELYSNKLTYLKLNEHKANNLPNGKTLTYVKYWGFTKHQYQIFTMLDPELFFKQSRFFAAFQQIKITTFELDLIANYYIPPLKNYSKFNHNYEIIFSSFNSISLLFKNLYFELYEIMNFNIIIDEALMLTIISKNVETMYNRCISFIKGITLFYETYDEYEIPVIEIPVELLNLSSDPTSKYQHSSNLVFNYYKERLLNFFFILPFDIIELETSEAKDYAKLITSEFKVFKNLLDLEKQYNYNMKKKSQAMKNYTKRQKEEYLIKRQEHNKKSEKFKIGNLFNSVKIGLLYIILSPFIFICWFWFSIFSQNKAIIEPPDDYQAYNYLKND